MPGRSRLDQLPGSSERRHLTVMFCDVVGSTRLSGHRDVEATFAMLNAYYDACRAAVERHGGVIVQYQGDGIFVWFGYPRPRDDDAVRAVRAGLDLLVGFHELSSRLEPEIGERLAARIGVHAGEALVAPIESDGTTTAFGYTPNLAAKLQQGARAGTLVVSDAILRLIRDAFEVVDRQPVAFSDGTVVPVYEVVKERRREGRVGRGWLTPLIGRDTERARLHRVWGSVRTGDGAAVTLVGARGIGKTRLAAEVLSGAESDRANVLDCTCSHLHTNTPYWLFRTLLGEAAGVEPVHSPADAAGLVRDHLVGSLGLRPESVNLLGTPFGLPKEVVGPAPALDPSKLGQLITELLVEWVTRLAAAPTVILVDDVTDADPSSLTVLARLVGALPPRLLLVFTVRSDVGPAPFLTEGPVETIEVAPLDAEAAEALVDAVSDAGLEERARRHVLEQGEGVPLFLEELARAVGEGIGSGLPITLTGHLQARLLAPHVDREVAAVLAVASSDLGESTLAAVLGAAGTEPATVGDRISALLTSDLVVRTGVGPSASYRFRHGLIAEAAYGLLLREQRHRLHGKLADALFERRASGRPIDWNVVGRHLTLAGRSQDAFEAILAGADDASRTGAYREALQSYHDALDVLADVVDADTRDRLEIRCRVARGGAATSASGFGSDDAAADFDRCAELCRRLGPSAEHLSAITGMFSFYVTRGEPAVGRRLCDELRSWVEAGHVQFRADHALLLGLVDFFEGDYRGAGEHLALAAAEFAKRPPEVGIGRYWLLPYDPVAITQMYLGAVHWIAGRPDAGRTAFDQALTRARGLGFPEGPFSIAYAKSYLAWIPAITGDHRTAAGFAREVRDIGQRHGFAFWESTGAVHLALAEYRLRGQLDAVDTIERHAANWELIGGRAFLPYVLAGAADIRAAMGQPAAAAAGFEASARLARRTGLRFYEAERLRLHALALSGSDEDSLELLRQAWELANRQGALLFELRAALELTRRCRDPQGAERLASAVARIAAGSPEIAGYPEIAEARAILADTR